MIRDLDAKRAALLPLVRQLPKAHFDTLRYLMLHLNRFVSRRSRSQPPASPSDLRLSNRRRVMALQKENLMSARNLGVVFGRESSLSSLSPSLATLLLCLTPFLILRSTSYPHALSRPVSRVRRHGWESPGHRLARRARAGSFCSSTGPGGLVLPSSPFLPFSPFGPILLRSSRFFTSFLSSSLSFIQRVAAVLVLSSPPSFSRSNVIPSCSLQPLERPRSFFTLALTLFCIRYRYRSCSPLRTR